ncbi:MAG: redoxin domain-containing protein [Rhodospirillaceae bacterium]
MSKKIDAGGKMPEMNLTLVGGGTAKIGGPRDGWQMLVVYRGVHCPKRKQFMAKLDGLKDGFAEANTEIVCVSADSEDQATRDKSEQGIDLPVACGLTEDQMRALGLYISALRSEQETDHNFPEPGLFVVNPSGQVQIVDISNAPF